MADSNRNPSPPLQRSRTDRADGFDSRNRNLEHIDQIFRATGAPADFIADLLDRHQSLAVLEIGFGWGIALLELAWRFRSNNVAFYGIDIEEKPELSSPEGIVTFARERGIIPKHQSDTFNIPSLYFCDASTLGLDDESMDFIYSAVTIRFIRKKIEFIEDVARVLRPGGKALLHIGESNWHYPHTHICDQRILTPHTSRLILKYEKELIPLTDYFKLFEGNTFEFHFTENSRCILTISKLRTGKLDLNLEFNDELTLPGRAVPLINRKGELRGGIRTVYDVRTKNYRALLDNGLISTLVPPLPTTGAVQSEPRLTT